MLHAKLSAMPGVGGWGMYGGNRLIWVGYVWWGMYGGNWFI